MSKYRSLGLLVFALILATLAMFGAMNYLEEREREMQAALDAQANYVSIIVPSRPLNVGDVVTPETVSLRQVPSDYIPDGALAPSDFDLIAGMVLKEPASEGRPLLRSALEGLAAVEKFSQLLSKGQRAITLDVSRLDTAENMLVPGDYIDLLLMRKNSLSSEEGASTQSFTTAEVLLERVLVLATGVYTVADPAYSYSANDEGYSTLTLGVSAEDAARILSMKKLGNLTYLLRNPEDFGRGRYSMKQKSDVKAVEVLAGGRSVSGMLQTSVALTGDSTFTRSRQVTSEKKVYKKYDDGQHSTLGNDGKESPRAIDVTKPGGAAIAAPEQVSE